MADGEYAEERRELVTKVTALAERRQGKPLTPEKWRAEFARFDRDGDGALTVAEVRKWIKEAGVGEDDWLDWSETWATTLVQNGDRSGNGTIELPELMHALKFAVPSDEDVDDAEFWGPFIHDGIERMDRHLRDEYAIDDVARSMRDVAKNTGEAVRDVAGAARNATSPETWMIVGGVVLLVMLAK